MRVRILFLLLLGFTSSSLQAFCDGFQSSNNSCESDPARSASAECDHYLETVASSSDGWYMDYYFDDSTPSVTAYEYRCLTYINGASGPYISGGLSGRVVFQSCRGNATSTATSQGCFVECDVPLVNGECPKDEENTCPQGAGPINFLTGNKLFTEIDYETTGLNRLHFTRYYNSQNNRERRSAGGWVPTNKDTAFFESNVNYWVGHTNKIESIITSGNPFKRIIYRSVTIDDGSANGVDIVVPAQEKLAIPMKRVTSVWRNNYDLFLVRSFHDLTSLSLVRENGSEYKFIRSNANESVYYPDRVDNRGAEQVIVHATGFLYVKQNLDKEHYGINGELTAIETKNGYLQTLTYNNGALIEVADSQGRALSFTHDLEGRIETMTTPEGYEYRYNYVGLTDLVDRVYYPDGDSEPLNNPYRRYVYEDVRFPNAVTGIYENEQRYGTYAYGDDGKAIYSGLANGAQAYSVNFDVAGQTTVTNALGKNTVYHYDAANNLVQIVGEPSANCLGDARNFTYDSNNFLTSETDKNGNITTYTRDAFGREISRTEAYGTPQARTITTEWDSVLNVKTKITEPERITNFTYDANGLLLNQTVTPVAP